MQRASITPNAGTTSPKEQDLLRQVNITAESLPPDSFVQAELIFESVDHSDASFEALIYFNNPTADQTTGRSAETGYVGSFDIFGHGRCFGAPGHCAVPNRPLRHGDLREPHALTPVQKRVVITDALKHVLTTNEGGLTSMKIVPVTRATGAQPRQPAADLLRFGRLTLKTY